MTVQEKIFLLIFIINTGVALIYCIWGLLIHRSEEKKRAEYLMKTVVMILCPIVGPVFFLAGNLICRLFFRHSAELEDVIFSKEKVTTRTKADEEAEGNMVPLEEALAVSDKSSLRTLMLNVVRGDIQNSLASISLALNSEDTETAHYAAAVLQESLNDFRQKVQELYLLLEEKDENACECACLMLESMNGVLRQGVFEEMEQRKYVGMMEEAGRYLYENKKEQMKPQYMEWIILRLLELEEFERAEAWCEYSREMYPDILSTYTSQLKLYFTIQDKKNFFEVLNKLKKSDVVIDKATLELIRAFRESEDTPKHKISEELITETKEETVQEPEKKELPLESVSEEKDAVDSGEGEVNETGRNTRQKENKTKVIVKREETEAEKIMALVRQYNRTVIKAGVGAGCFIFGIYKLKKRRKGKKR